MRTTVELRDDIYRKIIREYGKRKISITINEILEKFFSKKRKDMFGSDPWLKHTDLSDLRDEHDRNI
jgi:predicted CopG family antitoxin